MKKKQANTLAMSLVLSASGVNVKHRNVTKKKKKLQNNHNNFEES